MDQPICMIDVADANAAYYYHYDALGSVVALSDSAGDTVQLYEYDVYGQVAASDPNHPNPFLFTGRRYDTETGLYYYRARYYNASIGRFLQTDPIGYGDGMNMYAYCHNNPVGWADPSGLTTSSDANNAGGWEFWEHEVGTYADLGGWLRHHGYIAKTGDLSLIVPGLGLSSTKPTTIKIGRGKIAGVTVYTLNGIGLLDRGTLDAIIRPTIERINSWTLSLLHNIDNVKGDKCDTAFFRTHVKQWLWWNRLYDEYGLGSKIHSSKDINYIAEGHAMAHFSINRKLGHAIVWAWKLSEYNRWLPSDHPVYYWFDLGYDGYGTRKDWSSTGDAYQGILEGL